MYIKTKNAEDGERKRIYITSPLFDIDDVRKIKAFIRFNSGDVRYEGRCHDKDTILKFGRVTYIVLDNYALHSMAIRMHTKQGDVLYDVETTYNDGRCDLTIAFIGNVNE